MRNVGAILMVALAALAQINIVNARTEVADRGFRFQSQENRLAGDRDSDGLTDDEEAQLGTDPANPDTDGDALLDGWEVRGVNGIDLAAMGASPLHKDI